MRAWLEVWEDVIAPRIWAQARDLVTDVAMWHDHMLPGSFRTCRSARAEQMTAANGRSLPTTSREMRAGGCAHVWSTRPCCRDSTLDGQGWLEEGARLGEQLKIVRRM